MGEVIGFKRTRRPGAISTEKPRPINHAEPITADRFPAWGQGSDTAMEYSAPERDGA
jgi:hypothetical protein